MTAKSKTKSKPMNSLIQKTSDSEYEIETVGIGLSNKQQRFCDEYVIDRNATQTAIRAGYSKKSARAIGCENLTKPNIVREIDRLDAENPASSKLWLTNLLATIAQAAPSDFLDWSSGSVKLKSLDEIGEEKMTAVSEIIMTKTSNGSSVRIKLHDKNSAVDKLCKILGYYNEQPVADVIAPITVIERVII